MAARRPLDPVGVGSNPTWATIKIIRFMNKLYEPFDSTLNGKMNKLLNDLELIDEQVRIKGLENNIVFIEWQDKMNKIITK